MSDQCRVVEVDGQPVRVRGARPLTDADQAALAEVVRAARAKLLASPSPVSAPCPECGALPGEPCRKAVSDDGVTRVGPVHQQRRQAARDA